MNRTEVTACLEAALQQLKASPEQSAVGPNGLRAVLVRTTSAGVHFGYLVSKKGKEVELTGSRRIWRWFGANTLSEIATSGLDSAKSNVAVAVDITLTEAIEIIPCSAQAVASIEAAKWPK